MPEGTITTITTDRGFGVITPDDGGQDRVVHHTAVADQGFERLRPLQRVTVDQGEDPRTTGRQQVVNVRPAA